MGSCIICGASTDGRICDLHEEDVVFEFRGDRPDQLTVDRFYRGTVDGYAEFGVFVDIGDSVTGLLHRSELDRRLENLDWEEGDTVFVQVTNVRDNGNVDLTWSIRQSEAEFRGTLVDDPDQGAPFVKDEESDGGESGADTEDADDPRDAPEADSDRTTGQSAADGAASTGGAGTGAAASTGTESTGSSESAAVAAAGAGAVEVEEPAQAGVDSLPDRVGETVRIEGVVETARQTSGPTVFGIRDETGSVECAAFEEAGVRAYPEISVDDVVRLDGEVRERRGEIQVETEALVVLEGEDRDAVEERLAEALREQADPGSVDPLVED
ncbi:DNA-binding protein, partial [Halobacteriales archaeon QH_6_68_27]